MLSLFEGRREDPVTLEHKEPGQDVATWSEAGAPGTKAFATLAPEDLQPFPQPPAKLAAAALSCIAGAAKPRDDSG